MSAKPHALVRMLDRVFLTDGGIETTLIFHEGWDLPHFSAFPLAGSASGRDALLAYYERYIHLAQRHGTGFILESPTWRASPGWAEKVGYSKDELEKLLMASVDLLIDLKRQYAGVSLPMLISGCVGPHDDRYQTSRLFSPEEAENYHGFQIETMAKAGVDMITAVTLRYPEEAIGIVRAAKRANVPAVISFTVETDGCLPNGSTLESAIESVDDACKPPPAYYMINCAHPDHFSSKLKGEWVNRIGGLRCNASRVSHPDLDDADSIDEGDPSEFGRLHTALAESLPALKVFGGCCGADHRHVDAVASNMAETSLLPTDGPRDSESIEPVS